MSVDSIGPSAGFQKLDTTQSRTRSSTGAVDSTRAGAGTFARTVTTDNGVRTVNLTDTFANGRTVSSVSTFNPDGTATRSVTTTLANGKTTTRQENFTPTTGGGQTITGTITLANGMIDQIAGSSSTTSYGSQTDLTFTDAAGKTASLDYEHLAGGGAHATIAKGTGFDGTAISGAALYASGAAPTAGAIDSTEDGTGTYSVNTTDAGGNSTSDIVATFAGGAQTTTKTEAANADGSTTDSWMTQMPTGATRSANETFGVSANGVSTVTGSMINVDGTTDQITGTRTATDYGTDTSLTYTDANGKTSSMNQFILTAGDATLSFDIGTDASGQATGGASLVNVPPG